MAGSPIEGDQKALAPYLEAMRPSPPRTGRRRGGRGEVFVLGAVGGSGGGVELSESTASSRPAAARRGGRELARGGSRLAGDSKTTGRVRAGCASGRRSAPGANPLGQVRRLVLTGRYGSGSRTFRRSGRRRVWFWCGAPGRYDELAPAPSRSRAAGRGGIGAAPVPNSRQRVSLGRAPVGRVDWGVRNAVAYVNPASRREVEPERSHNPALFVRKGQRPARNCGGWIFRLRTTGAGRPRGNRMKGQRNVNE